MSADLVWGWAAVGFALLVPAALWAGRRDTRLLDGVRLWAKPFKFALSLAIHFATFAVIARCLSDAERQRGWLVAAAAASAAAGALELAYIAVQAARGRHSHFNTATRLEAVASVLMGVGALVVIAPGPVVGIALALAPPAGWPAAVVVGTVCGLVGGAALTVLTAGRMGAVRSHYATGRPAVERFMPVTGWSLTGADLRPSHFLATHMMQVVPAAAVIAAWVWPAPAAMAASVAVALGWTAVTLALFRRTVRRRVGQPVSGLRM